MPVSTTLLEPSFADLMGPSREQSSCPMIGDAIGSAPQDRSQNGSTGRLR